MFRSSWIAQEANKIQAFFAFGLFALILAHGSLLGLTDDEAYYWVLAQKPAFGYAYHPPAVAWAIAAAEAAFGWLFGANSTTLVRLPAATCAASILFLGLGWIREVGGTRVAHAGWMLLSFAGFFALSWMMVPDLPLFLGWMLAFRATWRLCFSAENSRWAWVALPTGILLAILSKYSGLLAAGSAGLCFLLWAPTDRRRKGIALVALSVTAACIPIIAWNATHDWASILYQIQERHGVASFSILRYLRFWLVEAVLAGPLIVVFAFRIMSGRRVADASEARVMRFIIAWMLPAALVFCVQPLWSDFKPHWAFVVWWPAFLALAYLAARGAEPRWIRSQPFYGITLGVLILLSCQLPIWGWLARAAKGDSVDPRIDVTNDMYGWSELRGFLAQKLGSDFLKFTVVGSRYQTASQAAFALGDGAKYTLLPRDLKARDEWPDLPVAESHGPEWPRLKTSVLFIADNRYASGPEYPGASCAKLGRLERRRLYVPAKWIDVWRCDP
jgi:hypothetical protein